MPNTVQPMQIGGKTVWVEISNLDLGSPPLSEGEGIFANTSAKSTVTTVIADSDIGTTLQAVAGSVQKAFESLMPDEVNLEVSLGFKAGGGVFVASGEANAQIKVSAKWKTANKV